MAPLAEVGGEQSLGHLQLLALLLGVVQQLVRLAGVGVQQCIEVVPQPDVIGDGADLVEHLAHLPGRHPLVPHEEVDLGAVEVHRSIRGQLEAVVGHLDVVAAGEVGEPGLELAFADVAPRARDVGPDIHGDRSHVTCNSPVSIGIPSVT